MNRLSILVRTDADWIAMNRVRFVEQQGTLNIPPALRRRELAPLIDLWERATGYSFYLYREAVRRACYAELLKVGCPVDKVHPTGDIVVCVDDDDIIYPSVLQVASVFDDTRVNVVTWNRLTEVHGVSRVEGLRPYLDTCNFAIRRSWLDTWSLEDRTLMLAKHQVANRLVGQRLGILPKIAGVLGPDMFKGHPATYSPLRHPSIVDLDAFHSIYHLHSASISYLSHRRKADDSLSGLPLHPLFDDDIYRIVEKERDNRYGDNIECNQAAP